MKAVIFASALILATSAHAAPPEAVTPATPPGHGPARVTPDMLVPQKAPQPSELPNKGKVKSIINSNGYAYVEVDQGKEVRWIAGPEVAAKVGDTIGFSDGVVMSDFYSKALKRSFPSILFADHVAVIPAK